MFDRFTDRSRKVMALARKEAQRFNHDFIGTEHILLGLVAEGSGVAANVLKNLGVETHRIRSEIDKKVQAGPSMVTMSQLPFTPSAKKALEYAVEESSGLGHHHLGTEHLLLGVLRVGGGVAAQVLEALQVQVDDVRKEILELYSDPGTPQERLSPDPTAARIDREVTTGASEHFELPRPPPRLVQWVPAYPYRIPGAILLLAAALCLHAASSPERDPAWDLRPVLIVAACGLGALGLWSFFKRWTP